MELFILWMLIVFYLSTNIVYAVDLYTTYKKANGLTMAFYCKAMYLLVEAIVPLIIIGAYTIAGKTYTEIAAVDFSREGLVGLLYYWILTVIGYIALHLGIRANFRFIFRKKKLKPRQMMTCPAFLTTASYISLAVGIVSFYLWTRAYGGIGAFIEVANAVRGGWSNVVNPLAFFKHPSRLCIVASYAFFTIFCSGKRKLWITIPLLVSVIFSVLFLLAADGRFFAGFYFLTFVIIYIRARAEVHRKASGKRLVLVGLVVVAMAILMMKMNDITAFVRTGVWPKGDNSGSMFDSLINEFVFILSSGQYTVMNSDQIGIQFFNDLGYGLFAWLPTALKPAGFSSNWRINTELLGFLKSGTIPFDIITQGFYDLRLVGVFLFPFCFGRVIRLIDEKCSHTPYGTIVFAALVYTMTRAIPYGEMYDFVLGLFGLAIYCVIYWFVKQVFMQRK